MRNTVTRNNPTPATDASAPKAGKPSEQPWPDVTSPHHLPIAGVRYGESPSTRLEPIRANAAPLAGSPCVVRRPIPCSPTALTAVPPPLEFRSELFWIDEAVSFSGI